jgi:hypothetical protein
MASYEGIQTVASIAMDPSSAAEESTAGGRLLKKASIRLQRTFSRILRDQAQNRVAKDYVKVQMNFLRRVIVRRRQLAAKEAYNELLERHGLSPPSSWRCTSVESATSEESEIVPNLNGWSIYIQPDLSVTGGSKVHDDEKREMWRSAWATWLASSEKGLKQSCRQLQRWWRGHREILRNRKGWKHFMNTIGRVEIDESAVRQSIALEALSEFSLFLTREMIGAEEQLLRRRLRSERAVTSSFLYDVGHLSKEEQEVRMVLARNHTQFWLTEVFPFQRFRVEYFHWVGMRERILEWRVQHLSLLHNFLLPCAWTMKTHLLLDFSEGLGTVEPAVNDGRTNWSPSPSAALGRATIPVHIPFQATPVPPSSSIAKQRKRSSLPNRSYAPAARDLGASTPTKGPSVPKQSVNDSIGALLRSPRLARWQSGMTVGNEVTDTHLLSMEVPNTKRLEMLLGQEADGRLTLQDDEETAWLRLVWVWTMKSGQPDRDRPPGCDEPSGRPTHIPVSPPPRANQRPSNRGHGLV